MVNFSFFTCLLPVGIFSIKVDANADSSIAVEDKFNVLQDSNTFESKFDEKENALAMLNSRTRRGRWEEEFVNKAYTYEEIWQYMFEECYGEAPWYEKGCNVEEWKECKRQIGYETCTSILWSF